LGFENVVGLELAGQVCAKPLRKKTTDLVFSGGVLVLDHTKSLKQAQGAEHFLAHLYVNIDMGTKHGGSLSTLHYPTLA
jgi:hypothetical protein